MSPFWFVAVLVSPFSLVAVLVCRRFDCTPTSLVLVSLAGQMYYHLTLHCMVSQ